jgi:hypothetical protein
MALLEGKRTHDCSQPPNACANAGLVSAASSSRRKPNRGAIVLKLVSNNPNPRSPAPRIPRRSYTPQHFTPDSEPLSSRLAIAALLVAFIAVTVLGFWLDQPGVLP